MKRLIEFASLAFFALLCGAGVLHGQSLQLLTSVDPAQESAGGGGDSCLPIITPDGRFVVFASTANNLLVNSNGLAVPERFAGCLNIYRRDRLYQTNVLVSVNMSGLTGGDGDSIPSAVSTDGRYVLFESTASDLVSGDTNDASDVFVRDVSAGTTTLVSAALNGGPGNAASRSPTMTSDGRSVAFVSAASNLVPDDTNFIADVFVRDLRSGTTVLASVGAASAVVNACSSEAPDITADGRYVAFCSTASNLVGEARGGSDIYVRDLSSNVTLLISSYARVAIPSNDVVCFSHAFSADGKFLAYEAIPNRTASEGTIFRYSMESGLTDIVATNAAVPRGPFETLSTLDINANGAFIAFVANGGSTNGGATCIRLWDAQSGSSVVVSGNPMDPGFETNNICLSPAIDATGRYIAFASGGGTNGDPLVVIITNLVLADFHLYLHDTQTGSRVLLDTGANGAPSNLSPATAPRLTPDARFVAFECPVSQLASNAGRAELNVFFRDVETSAVELISAHDPALPTCTPNGHSTITQNSVSADGRYVAFVSDANNIVRDDTNGFPDVFVRDQATGITTIVNVGTNGVTAGGFHGEPSISANGRFIAFTSTANNLVTADNNRASDVFMRDLQAGTTRLVSVNVTGSGSARGSSWAPVLSSDARFVLFRSTGRDLAPGFGTGYVENLFVRDLQTESTYALTQDTGIGAAAMTPDGRFVAVADKPGATVGKICIWDSLAAAWIYTNVSVGTIMLAAISPDGNRLAYWTGVAQPQLYAVDRSSGTSWTLTSGTVRTPSAELCFSGNSQVLAYNKASSLGPSQVYCYDFQTGASTLVSTAYGSGEAAAGVSDSPAVSANGRFIAYRSAAENIVPGDLNGQPDIFVYDRQSGTNRLLSISNSGLGSADNRSMRPVFSADGSTLVFETWASDMAPRDFNYCGDLLAYTFLTVALLPGSGSNSSPVISWPLVRGSSYTVQYKDNINDTWHDLTGSITNVGVKGFLQDQSSAPGQRFYRVKSF